MALHYLLADSSSKPSFGKIGLTLLTLVSVFMMMNRVSEVDSQSLATTAHHSEPHSAISTPAEYNDIIETGPYKLSSPVLEGKMDEKALMKQIRYIAPT